MQMKRTVPPSDEKFTLFKQILSVANICMYIQLLTFAYIQLLNKPYENDFTLKGQNICLKCYQPLDF